MHHLSGDRWSLVNKLTTDKKIDIWEMLIICNGGDDDDRDDSEYNDIDDESGEQW